MSSPVKNDRLARFAELVEDEKQTLETLFQRMTTPDEGGRLEGLPAICRAWDVPYGRLLTWLMADAKRYACYQRALEAAAHALIAQTVEIADGVEGADEASHVSAARLRTEVRFRLAEKHAPEMYGRREEVQGLGIVLVNASLERVADALLERLSGRSPEPRLIEENQVIAGGDGDI